MDPSDIGDYEPKALDIRHQSGLSLYAGVLRPSSGSETKTEPAKEKINPESQGLATVESKKII